MKWVKKGLLFKVNGQAEWMNHSALQPTPLLLGDMIRIFVGFRDKKGVGRVGYIDVNAENPSEVIGYSKEPILDVGEPGCFDDNGCVPCAVYQEGKQLYLFYAGYNLGYHVRMTIFSGVAVSNDFGKSFTRYSKIPIMERTEHETLFRVVHSVLRDEKDWKIYYGAGNHFIQGKNKTLPVYEIKLLQTNDLLQLDKAGVTIIHNCGDEYRVARPYVVKEDNLYKMFFCKGTEEITYRLAYAESEDGISWKRINNKLQLDLSKNGWDSEMMAYPAFLRYKNKAYLFYNGNNYGYSGVGYAQLVEN